MKKLLSVLLAVVMCMGMIVTVEGVTDTSIISVTASAASYTTGTYQVNHSNGVNVRKGAGTSYNRVGAASKGVKFKVDKIKNAGGYTWGHTDSIKCTNGTKSGWVVLSYCKYVSDNSSASSSSSASVSNSKYSFSSAYNYAKKYWDTKNNAYNYYPKKNCANFVSQILVASGVPTSSTWKNGTYAFVNVDGLKSYFKNNYNIKYMSNPSASDIKVGDVIYTNNGGHVMFVMSKSGNTIYASGNTNNRDEIVVSISIISGVLKTSALF